MFNRFSESARRVVVLSQEEARLLQHNYIGTEHLLLGLVHEGQGLAFRVLTDLDVDLKILREKVEQLIGHGTEEPSGQIPFTPRAKRVLELSLYEAKALHDTEIDTQHLLLGLVEERDGVAAQILTGLGADAAHVRARVLAPDTPREPDSAPSGDESPSAAAESRDTPASAKTWSVAEAAAVAARESAARAGSTVEQRVADLEHRVAELEQRLGESGSRAGDIHG
ncbi:Clp protease N-terminal domain-containing protein [Nocardia jejuensis]|uniref:Clp protease N-terminal domain-containing protein n=1 Tax=Nocardia jejuensis TaxID=328049 RepID=UPI000836B5A8